MTPSSYRTSTPDLIGRSEEVATVRSSCRSAVESGGTLLISGEAGIGKTRLAAEAVAIGREAGFVVVRAVCAEGIETPYVPIITALRPTLWKLGTGATLSCFTGAARLAAVAFPEYETGSSISPEALFPHDVDAAMVELLLNLHQGQPFLLLVEDVHWADADTLRFLSMLRRYAGSVPVWLVATARTGELQANHPTMQWLADLGREFPHVEVRLAGLDEASVRSLIAANSRHAPADHLVTTIVNRSAGNPLFIEELVRAAAAGSDVPEESPYQDAAALDRSRLPLTIRDTVLRRSRQFSADAVAFLRLAALAGEAVDVQLVSEAGGWQLSDIHRWLSAALEAGLLEERRENARANSTFRHALIRDGLLSEFGGPDRKDAHRKIADALVSLGRVPSGEVAGQVADHYQAAGDAGRAASFAVAAARHAVSVRSSGAARFRFVQAIGLEECGSHRLKVVVEAAESLVDFRENSVDEFINDGLRQARDSANAAAEARLLLVLARDLQWREDLGGAIRQVRQALSILEGRADIWELKARSRLVWLPIMQEDRLTARLEIEPALALARQLEAKVELANLYSARAELSKPLDAASRYDEALRCARDSGSLREQETALGNGAMRAFAIGDVARSWDWFRLAIEISEPVSPHTCMLWRASLARSLAVAGQLDQAVELASEARISGFIRARRAALLALIEVALRRGAFESLQSLQAEYEATLAPGPATAVLRVRLLARIDPVAAIRTGLGLIDRGDIPDEGHWWFTPDLASCLVKHEMSGELQWMVGKLRLVTHAGHQQDLAALEFADGLLRCCQADYDEGQSLLRSAVGRWERMPHAARCVEGLLALAEAEWAAGSHDRGAEAAARALELAQQLGAPSLVAEARRAMFQTGASSSRRISKAINIGGTPGLSSRELEVALLVAEGQSNAEIASSLRLSRHTVARHVSSILAKSSLKNRTAIARWVGGNVRPPPRRDRAD